MIALVIVLVGLAIALIFSQNFRTWLMAQMNALVILLPAWARIVWENTVRVLGWYSLITLILIIAIAILTLLGTIINVPWITAFCFILAIGLFFLVWIIPGISLRILGVNTQVFPNTIRVAVSWLAFLGFLGMLYPDALSFRFLLGLALLGFFSFGLASKTNVLDKVVYPLVVIMISIAVWKYAAPNSYRAITRNAHAHSDKLYTEADRNSITTEANARATYGHLLKDVSLAYKVTLDDDEIATISDTNVDLKKDSIFLIVNHQKENYAFEGQSFLEIKLPNSNGSYVTGKKIWIDADLIEIGSRGEIDQSLQSGNQEDFGKLTSGTKSSSESFTLHSGEQWFPDHLFQPGEKIIYVIEYAAMNSIRTDGSRILVPPGRYEGTMTTVGTPAFEGVSKLSKITVFYNI